MKLILNLDFFSFLISDFYNHNIFAEDDMFFLIIGNAFDVSLAYTEILNN